MTKVSVEFIGLDEFRDIIRQSPKAVQRRSKQFAPVQSGRLRTDIQSEVIENDMMGRVYNDVTYAIYVHEGTRPSPGRYVPAINARVKTGMHPGQRPQQYMRQALDYVRGKSSDILANRIQKRLDLIAKRGLTPRR